MSLKHTRPLPLFAMGTLVSLYACTLASAQTTGFNQTGAGPHNYNNTANWVGETINGVWNSDLTLAAAQTVTFGADTGLTTGLNFRYDGAQNVTLRSDGVANRTLTLAGDINVDTVNTTRTITIGSTTANQGLNVDLGSAIRTFSVGGHTANARTLTFLNNVTNGGLVLNGGGFVNLNGNDNTLSSLRIQNAGLRITGNNAANTATTVSGALTIDGAASSVASNTDNLGGIATITLTPNGARNTTLAASDLVRENKGVAFFRGNNLGGTLGANGASNITFTNAPTLIGSGGTAGSTNISIIGWAVGATTAAGNANTFVTYDAVNGIRALNTTTEFENYVGGYTDVVTGTANSNTRITGGTVTLTGNNTVNSLFLGDGATNTAATLAGDGGTLTVTSGAVFLHGTNSTISSNLNFGAREGVIGYMQGQSTSISGGIAGSGGLTVYQAHANTSAFSAGSGINFSGAATFTGDFTVNSRAGVSHSDFLAHGARTGNVVVNGLLTLTGLGTDSRGYTMNGLYGNGRLSKGNSGAGLFRIGDNDANGNFSGTITDGGNTVIEKIGSGTQIFSGANSHNGATRILGGTLEVTQLANGLVNSGLGRTSNIASNLVINGGTLKYTGVATSTDRLFQVGQTTTGAVGTINASGTGAVNFTNTGAIAFGTAGTASVAQTRTLVLTGTNTGDNTLSALIGNNGAAINGNSDVGVTKSGTGTWVLAGANTYRGATTVNGGTLALGANNAFSANSAIDLNAGGTIDLRSFSSSAASLDFAAGSTLKFNLGAANSPSALLALTGALAKSGEGVFTLDFSGSGEIGTYNLASFSSTAFADSNEFTIANLGNGLTGLLNLDGSSLSLTVAAIPEPSTYALLLGAAGMALATARRTRRTL